MQYSTKVPTGDPPEPHTVQYMPGDETPPPQRSTTVLLVMQCPLVTLRPSSAGPLPYSYLYSNPALSYKCTVAQHKSAHTFIHNLPWVKSVPANCPLWLGRRHFRQSFLLRYPPCSHIMAIRSDFFPLHHPTTSVCSLLVFSLVLPVPVPSASCQPSTST